MPKTTTKPPEVTYHYLDTNFSSRLGEPIQAVALHSTESSDIKASWDDLHGVRNWFNNDASDASAHAGIDGDGHIERWVKDSDKAWTILSLNPVTLNIEFVGRAAQPTPEWERAQLRSGAKLTAYWCRKHGIPVRRGAVKNINGRPVVTRTGIILHSDLTAAGFGLHTDPGKNFPIRRFIRMVRYYRDNGWEPNTPAKHQP